MAGVNNESRTEVVKLKMMSAARALRAGKIDAESYAAIVTPDRVMALCKLVDEVRESAASLDDAWQAIGESPRQ